jgi:disulfide bond formation protein DsbB
MHVAFCLESGTPLIRAGIPVMAVMKNTHGTTLRVQKDTAPALLAGGFSLALLLGAVGFQYLGGLAPCEMCMWQRWPHGAAILLGLGGGALALSRGLPRDMVRALAWLAIVAIAISGAIGVFHAGVEWKLWPGPPTCTGGLGRLDAKTMLEALNSIENARADWSIRFMAWLSINERSICPRDRHKSLAGIVALFERTYNLLGQRDSIHHSARLT